MELHARHRIFALCSLACARAGPVLTIHTATAAAQLKAAAFASMGRTVCLTVCVTCNAASARPRRDDFVECVMLAEPLNCRTAFPSQDGRTSCATYCARSTVLHAVCLDSRQCADSWPGAAVCAGLLPACVCGGWSHRGLCRGRSSSQRRRGRFGTSGAGGLVVCYIDPFLFRARWPCRWGPLCVYHIAPRHLQQGNRTW